MFKGLLTDGAFSAFDPDNFKGRVAILTDGAFSPFLVVEDEIVFAPVGTKLGTVQQVVRELWKPNKKMVPVVISIWDYVRDRKELWFSVFERKYDERKIVLSILERKLKGIPINLSVYDIYVIENMVDDVEIKSILLDSESFKDDGYDGWTVIDD